MKKQLLSLFTVAVLISTSASSQSWEWVQQFGASGYDAGFNISADNYGNNYVSGAFGDSIVFGTTQLYASGWDMFFAKLDSNGIVQWALKYGGSGNDYGYEIIPDNLGNCYLLGAFENTLIIGNYTLVSAGMKDMFLAKIDSNQNVVWAKSGGGTGNEEPFSIRLDAAGNCYMITPFQNTAYFDAASVVSAGGYDIALVKYDSNGNVIWAKGAGGSGTDVPYSISIVENNDVIMGGHFSTTCSFDTISVTSYGAWDVFIAKYDSAGNALWVTRAGGNGDDGNTVVRVGSDNSIYVAGSFLNSVYFDTIHLITSGSVELFVAKCDSAGNFLWAERAGSTNVDVLNNMTIDENNNMYITGYYGGNATFGSITVPGSFDIFIAKYDPSGTSQWVKTAKGTGGQHSQEGHGIAVNKNSVYVTGSFANDLNFDNSSLSFPTASADDIYVAKISQTPTGINDLNVFANPVAIYPNPAATTCTITAPAFLNSELFIYDIAGRVLIHENFNEQATINVSALQTGIYVVEIKDKEGKSVKGKLVKEN